MRGSATPARTSRPMRPVQSWQLYGLTSRGSVNTSAALGYLAARRAAIGSRSHSWLASVTMTSGSGTGIETTSEAPAPGSTTRAVATATASETRAGPITRPRRALRLFLLVLRVTT